ncbi:MAG: hypothetical protein ABSG24_01815 [Acidimicrobiales bacterium]|jgi:hypothetical protein
MSLTLYVVVAVVVALGLIAVALRLRKLRRDEIRRIANRVDRRLVEPPPSPYTPSRGFRLLDGPLNSPDRPEPPRPRLEPNHEYVFSESQIASYQESVSPLGRHDERWALSKSMNRSRFSSVGVRFSLIVLVVVVVGIVALYYVERGRHPHAGTTTTTTTTLAASSAKHSDSTVVWPTSLVATSHSGEDATYVVPVARYRVTVTASAGPVWTVYQMGPRDTLEWQGKLLLGSDESLSLSGTSRITLGSPRSATVRVGASDVTFPSPLPPTLTLILEPSTTSSG